MTKKFHIQSGQIGRKKMPHSEACMFLRVAGKYMYFRTLEQGYGAQLLDEQHNVFSFPLLPSEIGLYPEEYPQDGGYYYPHEFDTPTDEKADQPPPIKRFAPV